MTAVSTLRLNVLRALYLLVFAGQGTLQMPRVVHHAATLSFSFWDGVGTSMLAGLALSALLGLRYPLQMLPLLLFELAWKLTWLATVALPLWKAGRLDAETLESLPSIGYGALLVTAFIPWRYVCASYIARPSERWS